jgi:hypothetical protein
MHKQLIVNVVNVRSRKGFRAAHPGHKNNGTARGACLTIFWFTNHNFDLLVTSHFGASFPIPPQDKDGGEKNDRQPN